MFAYLSMFAYLRPTVILSEFIQAGQPSLSLER